MEGQIPRSYSLMMHQGPTYTQHHGLVRPRMQTYYASVAEPSSHQPQPLDGAKLNTASFVETRVTPVQANEGQDTNSLALDVDKLAIYKHPLFPLLVQLLEKCELTTNSVEEANSSSFDVEIKAFVMQQAKEGKAYLINDAEIDSLMIKALQVLRIHLLELEKVNELCKDFCSRYIACLRGKLNSENLMRTLNVQPGSPIDDDMLGPSNSSAGQSDEQEPLSDRECSPSFLYPQQLQTMPAFQYLSAVKGDTYQPPVTFPSDAQPSSNASTQQATAFSNDIVDESSQESITIVKPSVSPPRKKHSRRDRSPDLKALKRGVLPKQATSIMKAWLFQHLVHPYPSEEEKKQIAEQCNLKILQVNNWFINARRRILQPMLESSPYSSRNRKMKPQKCPAQRAWPDAIGVMTPYTTETSQFSAAGTLPDFTIVNHAVDPQSASGVSMIINVPANSTTQTQGSATPLQYIQVAGLPSMVHGVAGGILQMTPTLQQCIVAPVDNPVDPGKAPTSSNQVVNLPVSVSLTNNSGVAPNSSAGGSV